MINIDENAYYYIHENGTLHRKVNMVVDCLPNGPHDYFDSPFVKDWFHGSSVPEKYRYLFERKDDA